jgi:hypothetical protein
MSCALRAGCGWNWPGKWIHLTFYQDGWRRGFFPAFRVFRVFRHREMIGAEAAILVFFLPASTAQSHDGIGILNKVRS